MPEAPKIFVIMSFGGDEATKFYSRLVYDSIIVKAVHEALGEDVEPERIDYAYADPELSEAIRNKLQEADVVIADVSNNNPNVLFELGFRHAQDKPFVCISVDPDKNKFWAQRFQITNYCDSNAVERIVKQIKEAYVKVVPRRQLLDELADLAKVIRGKAIANELQGRVAAWRLSIVREQISSILAGNWHLPVKTKHEYAFYILEGFIGRLEEGETYSVLSDIELWAEAEESATDGLFKECVQAVVRGVRIERIFHFSKQFTKYEKGKQRKLHNILLKHQDAALRMGDGLATKFNISCYTRPAKLSNKMAKELDQCRHFAVMSYDDEKGCVIRPAGNQSPDMPIDIEVEFSSNVRGNRRKPVKQFENRFQFALKKAVALDKFLSDFGKK